MARIPELQQADNSEYEAALAGPIQPPPGICRNDPPRETFSTLSAAERQSFADRRGECAVILDKKGNVEQVFAPRDPPEVSALGAVLHAGDHVQTLLDAKESEDLDRLLNGDEPDGYREYNVRVAETGPVCMETSYPAPRGGERVLFFRLSRYIERFALYRPLTCRVNWYHDDFTRSMWWTNSLGYRDREIDTPKPAGRLRVLCLGGSTTVEGPHNALTYPKYLERRLRTRLGEDRVEVINCGVDAGIIGTTVAQTRRWLALQPDLVVHYNFVNDLYGIVDTAIKRSVPPGSARGRLLKMLAESRLAAWAFPDWFMPDTALLESEIKKDVIEPLERMTREAQAGGVAVALCSFACPDANRLSMRERIYFDRTFDMRIPIPLRTPQYGRVVTVFNRMLKDSCRATGAIYVPVEENLTGGMETFADICHLRLPGIRRKADIVYDAVADTLAKRNAQ